MQVPPRQPRIPCQNPTVYKPPSERPSAGPLVAPEQTLPPSMFQGRALALSSAMADSKASATAPIPAQLASLERRNGHTVILRLPQLIKRIGLQRSAIYARLSPKSKYWDPSFPRPVALSAAMGSSSCHQRRRTAVGWIEAEVESYLQGLCDAAAKS